MNKYFLSCDWGTSSFRLRLIDIGTGKIISQLYTGQGTAGTYAQWKNTGEREDRMQFYLAIIQEQCKNIAADAGISIDGFPIIVSGMASSSIGMLELPYTQMPFAVSGNDLQIREIKKTILFPNDIILVSGARTTIDVMRGEETQLVGCVDGSSEGRQVFIFPGTHSKHVTVENNMATAVQTFMTGEFFELMTKKSILSDSVEAGGSIEDEENKMAFAEGVTESAKQNLLHSSFVVRTNQLLDKYSRVANYFYLSGLLIGTELHQLLQNEVSSITLVGDKKLQVNYLLALQLLNISIGVKTIDDATATIKGQLAIYNRIYK